MIRNYSSGIFRYVLEHMLEHKAATNLTTLYFSTRTMKKKELDRRE